MNLYLILHLQSFISKVYSTRAEGLHLNLQEIDELLWKWFKSEN